MSEPQRGIYEAQMCHWRLMVGQEAIVVFTPHVPVYFWLNRHNFGDIELKFCILP